MAEEQRLRLEEDTRRSWSSLTDETRTISKTIKATRGIDQARSILRLVWLAAVMTKKQLREFRA